LTMHASMPRAQQNGKGCRYAYRASGSRLIESPLVMPTPTPMRSRKLQPATVLIGAGLGYMGGLAGLSLLQMLSLALGLFVLWVIALGLFVLLR
jgi:hypothetical protein